MPPDFPSRLPGLGGIVGNPGRRPKPVGGMIRGWTRGREACRRGRRGGGWGISGPRSLLPGGGRGLVAGGGCPPGGEPDPERPERWGRLLDRLVHLAGVGGNRVWVPRDRARGAARGLAGAGRRGGAGAR